MEFAHFAITVCVSYFIVPLVSVQPVWGQCEAKGTLRSTFKTHFMTTS